MKNLDWHTLIPELQHWNNGAGIDPETWVGCEGNFRLASAYSLIFWPRFVEVEDMVVRWGVELQELESCKRTYGNDLTKVEALLNHIHIVDLHYVGCPDASAERVAFLGRVLKEIYGVKLAAEFPRREFVVDFYEPDNQVLADYQLTFHQLRK